MNALACAVRGCGMPLERAARAWVCARGHSFDIARSGYVNLLQPQDRRSAHAGDSREAVEARTRLLASGVGRAAVDALAEAIVRIDFRAEPVVVDLGCGGGELLIAMAGVRAIAGIGIDLSVAAIDAAARRAPHLTWVVANADRRLPLADGRVDLVVSLNGRRNPGEAARVLAAGGHLVIGLPAPDDLVELRAAIQGEGRTRARVETVIAEHPAFTLVEQASVREVRALTRGQLADLLLGTYRGRRTSQSGKAASLEAMRVTLATDVLVFRRT